MEFYLETFLSRLNVYHKSKSYLNNIFYDDNLKPN